MVELMAVFVIILQTHRSHIPNGLLYIILIILFQRWEIVQESRENTRKDYFLVFLKLYIEHTHTHAQKSHTTHNLGLVRAHKRKMIMLYETTPHCLQAVPSSAGYSSGTVQWRS